MTYCRLIPDDADDYERRQERAARQPQPWDDILDAPATPTQIAADQREIAALEENIADLEAFLMSGNPSIWEWMRLDALRDDLAAARAALSALARARRAFWTRRPIP